jgi:hypothetical protein
MDDAGLPLEHFIQALTSQLDRAQATMALKARAGLPLTFAVKDLTLDLRTHVEMVGSVVRLRPAGPGERDASTLHLSLTTITRPMIEENTSQILATPDEPSIRDVLGADTTDEEQRRLEWAGVYTVSQLRDVEQHNGAEAIGRVSQLPVDRLRRALQMADQPYVSRVVEERPEVADLRDVIHRRDRTERRGVAESPHIAERSDIGEIRGTADRPPLIRIHGSNLKHLHDPTVRIDGRAMPIISATDRELVIQPDLQVLAGTLSVEVGPDRLAEIPFDVRQPSGVVTPPAADVPVEPTSAASSDTGPPTAPGTADGAA